MGTYGEENETLICRSHNLKNIFLSGIFFPPMYDLGSFYIPHLAALLGGNSLWISHISAYFMTGNTGCPC
jgi:hypothetical protein